MHWITKLSKRIIGVEKTKDLVATYIIWAYKAIIIKNAFRRKLIGRTNNKYLFILSPPFCGSTLLNHIISSSKQVSSNNVFHSREGQQLPKIKEIIFENKNRWNPDTTFDWKFIKSEWEKYWDTTKPILLEKSPCSILRADVLAKAFDPAHFVIIYRNPYAHCEGIMRRNNWSPVNAAKFAIKCLRFQRKNMLLLKNTVAFSYEEMTVDPEKIIAKLHNHLPELKDIQLSAAYPTQNVRNKSLAVTNLNAEKIASLTPNQIAKINSIFKRNEHLLTFFNYKILN